MSAELKKDGKIRSSGRRYRSVAELIKKENISPEVQKGIADIEKETSLCQALTEIRLRAGLTQEQLADKMGVTQSAVSKWEAGPDKELTVQVISKYVQIAGSQSLMLVFGERLNHVESVKFHASEIKKNLSALAQMANDCEEMETAIQAYFGEAFFNLLTILAGCQKEMPQGHKGLDMNVRLFKQSSSRGCRVSSEASNLAVEA